MVRVGIIGAGRWGTTLAIILAKVGCSVKLFCLESELEKLEATRSSETLPDFPIPEEILISSDVISCEDRDFLFFAVPGNNLRSAWKMWRRGINSESIIVNVAKTLDCENKHLLLPSLIIDRDNPHFVHFACASFPEGLLRGSPTIGTAFSINGHASRAVVELFSKTLIRPYMSKDIIGGQIGSALKNTIAIACGIAEGLGFDATTKAALASRGLKEMRDFALHHLGHEETFRAGTTVMADLICTCFGPFSHNRLYGYHLASIPSEEAVGKVLGTIEGIHTTETLAVVNEHFKEMPISFAVFLIISGQLSPKDAIKELMNRPIKLEG